MAGWGHLLLSGFLGRIGIFLSFGNLNCVPADLGLACVCPKRRTGQRRQCSCGRTRVVQSLEDLGL